MRRVEPPGPVTLGVVFGTVFLDLVGFGIVLPLIPFFADSMGATPLVIGVIVASYSLMQLVFSPVWGSLSDRFGRRPLLILGLFGSAVSYLVFGLAESVAVLLVSRIVGGSMGATVPVAQAIIADSTAPEKRARGMGMIGAAFGLGFIFGPAIGGFLSQWGYAAPGFVAAGLTGGNAIVAVFLLPESLPPERRVRSRRGWTALRQRAEALRAVLRRAELTRPILVLFVMTWGFAGITTTLPLYLDDPLGMTAATAGGLFAYLGLVAAVVQGRFIGPLVDRHGERTVAVAGGLALAAGMLIIGAVPSLAALFVALALVGGGWGCVVPSIHSMISRRASDREQGEVLGVNQSSASAARVVGPVAAGWGFGALGPQLGFVAGAALVALGTLIAWTMKEAK